MAKKRDQEKVQVRDPNGHVHEMGRPNAQDMIAHNGWTMVLAGPSVKSTAVRLLEVSAEQQALAHSPRTLRSPDEARLGAMNKTSSPGPLKAVQSPMPDNDDDDVVVETAKIVKRTPRARPTRSEEAEPTDGDTALIGLVAKQPSGPDELMDLEGEENARVPKDE